MVRPVSRWTQGVQVKQWDPLRTRAIPECLRGVITTRCYANPRLPLPYQLINRNLHLKTAEHLSDVMMCNIEGRTWSLFCRRRGIPHPLTGRSTGWQLTLCSKYILCIIYDAEEHVIYILYIYIYVYSSRRQNTAINRDKKQTDRQTDTQTLQLILQHDIREKIT